MGTVGRPTAAAGPEVVPEATGSAREDAIVSVRAAEHVIAQIQEPERAIEPVREAEHAIVRVQEPEHAIVPVREPAET